MPSRPSEELKPALKWFNSKKWKPFDFQKEVWQAYLKNQHGLLNAPTGSGKTYALWWAVLSEWIRNNPENWQHKSAGGLQIIWITPLRALARDLQSAMQQVVDDLDMRWQVALRTGDTSSSERQRQLKKTPECLITTPESLHLLLAQKNSRQLFRNFKALVVDEWHELLGTKRGVQTELAISRLLHFTQEKPKIWAISATIGNIKQALEVLIGQAQLVNSTMVKADIAKKLEVKSIIPDEVDTFPWAGHMGLKLLPQILPIIEKSQSTLLFTNTRAQTEIWYQRLMHDVPELAGLVALHHGSLDREVRDWVENSLHEGKLKLVICTSSLDLGVDFKPVETVIQVGSPKGIARFMQRAGRSGHQPGATSVLYFLPTNALELLESKALKTALEKNICENRLPLNKPLDVLVQYLVTLAVGEGFYPDEILKQIKNSYSYQYLTEEEWQWALSFIVEGGETLGEYDEYNKVEIEEDGKYIVKSRKIAMRHRLSMGTIVSEPMMRVKYSSGGYIGSVEESFISRLKKGDSFWFAGRPLIFEKVKDLTALVRKGKRKKATIPRWSGGRLPLSSQLSDLVRNLIDDIALGKATGVEVEALSPILSLQSRWSVIPTKQQLLIENFKSRDGYHLVFYPFEGRAVHELLAALVAYRISQLTPITFSMAMNDYGFELLADEPIPVEEALAEDLFRTESLLDEVSESINATEMARRRFREIATIAGLIFTGFPGKPITNKHLQASSGIIFDVFQEYDPDNPLLQQAKSEALYQQMEIERLQTCMQRIQHLELTLTRPPRATPFAFPILVDRLRERLSSEDLETRVAKMQLQLEEYAAAEGFLK